MSERTRDISVHKDMLKAQIKAAESERQTIRYSSIIKGLNSLSVCLYYSSFTSAVPSCMSASLRLTNSVNAMRS